MPAPLRVALVRTLSGCAVALFALVLLNNVRPPFAWLGVLLALVCAVCARARAWPLARGPWVSLGVLAAALAALEFTLAEHHVLAGPVARTRTEFERGYVRRGGPVGYRPSPGTWSVRGFVDDEESYVARVTIAADGLRATPRDDALATRGAVLFFGGSFTFGEGLEDGDTLPARFGAAVDGELTALNFGFHGYGPHHMLAQVRAGLVDAPPEPPVAAYYCAIPDHVRRVHGLVDWDRRGPWFTLDEAGALVHRGSFDERGPALRPRSSPLLAKLRRSEIARRLLDALGAEEDLAVAIVVEARRALVARYPELAFRVVLWDRERGAARLGAALARGGLEVLRVSELVPEYGQDPERFRRAPGDAHPSAEANRRLAAALARLH